MSRTHELREGMRVKVVKDDVTGFVGIEGDIDYIVKGETTMSYFVLIDGIRYPFDAEELVPLAESTVIEGVVRLDGDYTPLIDGTFALCDELDKHQGKRVRVTIEVLADSADSQSQASAEGEGEGSPESDGEPT